MLKMVIDMELNLLMKIMNKKHPIILHNSPSGAIERIIYALIGKAATDSHEGRKASISIMAIPNTS